MTRRVKIGDREISTLQSSLSEGRKAAVVVGGYGLPRPFGPRNDILFDTVSTDFGAEITET